MLDFKGGYSVLSRRICNSLSAVTMSAYNFNY